jgi:glyoxylase-like metal-dependent hydrolase (beta-lactamase superfamily II)
MLKLEEVAEGTYRLETRAPDLQPVFSVYFIKEKNSNVMIEPGPAVLIPTIQEALQTLHIDTLKYIIPTHIHLDHAGGVGKLSQLYPEPEIVLNPHGVNHMVDPSRLIRSTKMAFGDDFETKQGAILPVPESRVRIAQDGDLLSVGDRQLQIIHTPGHAPHHNAIFDTRTKGLFCGEALGLIYSPGAPPLPAVAPPSFDFEFYLTNMDKLRKLQPALLFYSHGGVGYNPESLISAALNNSKTIGELILKALNEGKTEETILPLVGSYIWEHFNTKLDDYELASNVKGYIHYFTRNSNN